MTPIIRRDLVQGSDAWKEWRRDGVGGSDIRTIMRLSPYEDDTLDALFTEKTEGRERLLNYSMRRGIRLEPDARAAYTTAHGIPVAPVCVEHSDFPWVRASLDGYWSGLILEVKLFGWQMHDLILQGVVPDHVRVQLEWQMYAAGSDLCHLWSWNPGQRFKPADRGAMVAVTPDLELRDRLRGEVARFWQRVLEWRERRAAVAG
jgi:putative phage-type endonuclease